MYNDFFFSWNTFLNFNTIFSISNINILLSSFDYYLHKIYFFPPLRLFASLDTGSCRWFIIKYCFTKCIIPTLPLIGEINPFTWNIITEIQVLNPTNFPLFSDDDILLVPWGLYDFILLF